MLTLGAASSSQPSHPRGSLISTFTILLLVDITMNPFRRTCATYLNRNVINNYNNHYNVNLIYSSLQHPRFSSCRHFSLINNAPIVRTQVLHDPTAAEINNPSPAPLDPPKIIKPPLPSRIVTYFNSNRTRLTNYIIVVTLIYVGYEIIQIYFNSIETLLELKHENAIDYTYLLGGLSVITVGGIYYLSKSLLSIKPQSLYRLLLRYLKQDIRITSALGNNIQVYHSPTITTQFARNLKEESISTITTQKAAAVKPFRLLNKISGGVRLRAEKGVKYLGELNYYILAYF
jgi:hypothetical protein